MAHFIPFPFSSDLISVESVIGSFICSSCFLGAAIVVVDGYCDSVFCVFVMDRDVLSVYTAAMVQMKIEIGSRTLNVDVSPIKSTRN